MINNNYLSIPLNTKCIKEMKDSTCWFGPHVSGEFAAHVVVVGADVVKAPIGELIGTVELKTHDDKNIILSSFKNQIKSLGSVRFINVFQSRLLCKPSLQKYSKSDFVQFFNKPFWI